MIPDEIRMGSRRRLNSRHLVLCAAIMAAAGALGADRAAAQSVVAFVNGEPITSIDVAQRTRIIQAVSRRRPSRKETIEELVNDKIKLAQARRLGITITDAMVDQAFANMARSAGRGPSDFSAAIRQSGIDPRAFKAKLRADLAWRDVLPKMSPGTFEVRDADVVAALIARGEAPTAKAIQYNLRQVVFVIPRDSPDSLRAARKREADALRAKFSDCERDIHLAREYREVVVKDPVIRISTDLPERLQQLLAKTPDGQMTPPEPTDAGIEVVAVCGRKETVADLSSRSEIRKELLSQRVQAQEKDILDRLRRQMIIEYR